MYPIHRDVTVRDVYMCNRMFLVRVAVFFALIRIHLGKFLSGQPVDNPGSKGISKNVYTGTATIPESNAFL